jgi:hypothetical protein
MDEVVVTDQHSAERLAHFTLQPGDIAVADHGYGSRSSVATAVRQGADVVLRITPATFPVETAAGVPFDLIAWLRQGNTAQPEWQGWCVQDGLVAEMRALLPTAPPDAPPVVSTWSLVGLAWRRCGTGPASVVADPAPDLPPTLKFAPMGCHLSPAPEPYITQTVQTLKELDVDYIIPMHCIG